MGGWGWGWDGNSTWGVRRGWNWDYQGRWLGGGGLWANVCILWRPASLSFNTLWGCKENPILGYEPARGGAGAGGFRVACTGAGANMTRSPTGCSRRQASTLRGWGWSINIIIIIIIIIPPSTTAALESTLYPAQYMREHQLQGSVNYGPLGGVP
jgi:hypothetical protein